MFVSWFKYKKLRDDRDELICVGQSLKSYQREKESIIPESLRLQAQIEQLSEDVKKYKKLHADEFQKRLELVEMIRKIEDKK